MDPIDLALEAAQAGTQQEPAPAATPSEPPEVNPGAEPAEAPAEPKPDEGKKPPEDDPKRRQKDLDRQAQDIRKKEQKFQAVKERTLAEKAKAREALDQVEALRKGDARAILSSLGTLTGRDPIELLRELNLNLATDGKKPASVAESEALSALKKELAEVKAAQQKREQAEQAQQHEVRVRTELGALVIAERFPELAAYAKEVGPEKAAAEMRQAMGELAKRGENVTTYDVCARAEVGLRDARAKQPKTTPGSETRAAPVAANTEQEQSTPRGQSLAPSVASTATRTRPLTDEEALREQARLMPGVLADLGLG